MNSFHAILLVFPGLLAGAVGLAVGYPLDTVKVAPHPLPL